MFLPKHTDLAQQNPVRKIDRPTASQRQNSPRAFSKGDFNPALVTTPAPPTTPTSEVVFECKNEGFFAHPATCKKYFWCLDTPSQGMVAHTFSCPQGLYFNINTDGCDFLRNVNCGDKDTTDTEDEEVEDNSISDLDPTSLKSILDIVKNEGGSKKIEKEDINDKQIEKEAEERKSRISSKTKSRLSQLLNRGRPPIIQKDRETTERFKAPIKLTRPVFRAKPTTEKIAETTERYKSPIKLVRPVFKEKPVTESIEPNLDKDQKQAITFAQKQRLSQLFNRSRPPKLPRIGGSIKNITQPGSLPKQIPTKLEPIETEKELTNEEKAFKAENKVLIDHDKQGEPDLEKQEEKNDESELKLELLKKK